MSEFGPTIAGAYAVDSAAGVPVVVADVKGDVSGLAAFPVQREVFKGVFGMLRRRL
jgi:hypothetical protein